MKQIYTYIYFILVGVCLSNADRIANLLLSMFKGDEKTLKGGKRR